ncbi:PAS domain-containing protein, partial [Acinetobacter baumannii]
LLLEAVDARRQATSLRHALDNLDVGVAIIDGTGLLAHCNASLESILSQDLGLLVCDKGCVKHAHPEEQNLWQSALAMAAAGYAP